MTGGREGSEGGKMEGESGWKSGGGRTRLYTWPRVGVADEARSTPYRRGRAVREVTGPLN
jgi:hypothetical protein